MLYGNRQDHRQVRYGVFLHAAHALTQVLIRQQDYYQAAFIIFERGLCIGGGNIKTLQQ